MARTNYYGSLGWSDLFWPGNSGGNSNQPEQDKEPSQAHQDAETAIEDLRKKYLQKAKAEFESKAQKLRQERDEALRENWILQQRAEAALPEQMAAAGINGGASESTLANLRAEYQGNRNEIRDGFINELGEISAENSAQIAESENKYTEQWLEYLLSLAKMEEEFDRKKELGYLGL